MTTKDTRPYHHGNLRRAVLDAAIAVIAESGSDALSLRQLASRIGVSHGAPAHHFGDRAGLLTAVAAEGYDLLGDALEVAHQQGDFLEVGLAYVRFAVDHPAHFLVMYQPSLYRVDDPAVVAARGRAAAALYGSAGTVGAAAPATDVGLAGWCLMHGLATLWLADNLHGVTDDPIALARAIAKITFSSGQSRTRIPTTKGHAVHKR